MRMTKQRDIPEHAFEGLEGLEGLEMLPLQLLIA
jgi:hypothetical protein